MAVAFVAAALAMMARPARAVDYTPDQIGPPGSGAPIELYRPAGSGPFASVIVEHGCNGVAPSSRRWAARLRSWGYLAVVLDSFAPRGLTNVCGHGVEVSAADRAADARSAAAILSARPDVKRGRIAVIGFSHGAGGALAAGETEGVFAAAVAFYPWCPSRTGAIRTDTLILMGDADDWTPAPRCTALMERSAGQPVSLKIYPGAVHAFDGNAPRQLYFGHQIGGDPAAAADAIARTRAFLAAHLR